MERLSTTPFGQRPVTAGLLKAVARMADTPALPQIDKWHLLRELCVARGAFDISDRDLGVLEGLLSFFPDTMLGGNSDMVVFPSNRALSARCHGMAESTLRRHLARLVDAGLILRHDSPNGKRYAARDADGTVLRAFGFDLSPLHVRSDDILSAATTARREAAELKALRERVSLRKRDAQKLAAYGQDMGYPGNWDALLAALLDVTRILRRRLDTETLTALGSEVEDLLAQTTSLLSKAKEMSGIDVSDERQHQNSNTDSSDLEHCSEQSMAEPVAPKEETPAQVDSVNVPFPLLKRALPEALLYATEPIERVNDLARLGASLRGMIGISPSAWDDAVAAMGYDTAGLTICCLTERIHDIRSPGGYLRALTREASEGRYSVTRLIMALIHRPDPKS